MFIESIEYHHGTTISGKSCTIDGLNRDKYMTSQYSKMFPSLLDIKVNGSVAMIYAAGPSMHASDDRPTKDETRSENIIIKTHLGSKVYSIGRNIPNLEFITINADTCASSMKAIHDARHLLNEYDNVLIYAENMVVEPQLKFFEQLGIDIVCGDGISVVLISRDKTENSIAEITDTSWCWNNESSPMTVSREGYIKAINKMEIDGITSIKTHGTGTVGNNLAEKDIIPGIKEISYKNEIGHTQGASTAIEIGMLIDREKEFDSLVLASGLGGFYGACRIKSI